MIAFNIIIWSIVSAVWAALAWWKSTITGTKNLASVGAAAVVTTYIVKWRAS